VASSSFFKDVLNRIEVFKEGGVSVVRFLIIFGNRDVEVDFGEGLFDLEWGRDLGEVFDQHGCKN